MTLLRSAIERRLSVNEDEVRLSEGERKSIFNGKYLWPSKVTDIRTVENFNKETKGPYPLHLEITRTHSDGIKSFTGTAGELRRRRSIAPLISDLNNNPKALNRATRVEKIARRTKVTVGIVAALSFLAFSIHDNITDGGDTNHDKNPEAVAGSEFNETIDDCIEIVTGDETLVSITDGQAKALNGVDAQVCELAGHSYLVE